MITTTNLPQEYGNDITPIIPSVQPMIADGIVIVLVEIILTSILLLKLDLLFLPTLANGTLREKVKQTIISPNISSIEQRRVALRMMTKKDEVV